MFWIYLYMFFHPHDFGEMSSQYFKQKKAANGGEEWVNMTCISSSSASSSSTSSFVRLVVIERVSP